MFIKLKLYQIFLISCLIILGCTGTSSGDKKSSNIPDSVSIGTKGVVIKEFSIDNTQLIEGDSAALNLVIENLGTRTAQEITSVLTPKGLNVDDSQLNEDSLESKTDVPQSFDVTIQTFGVDKTYTPLVTVCYNYKADSNTELFVIDSNNFEIDDVPLINKNSSNDGPISLNIDFRSDYLRASSTKPKSKALYTKISNIGQGQIYNNYDDPTVFGEASKIQVSGVTLKFLKTSDSDNKIVVNNADSSNKFICHNPTQTEPPATNSLTLSSGKWTYKETDSSTAVFPSITAEVESSDETYLICKSKDEIRFSSSGVSTLKLPTFFEIKENGKEVITVIAEVDYRYCITTSNTDPLTINVKKEQQ